MECPELTSHQCSFPLHLLFEKKMQQIKIIFTFRTRLPAQWGPNEIKEKLDSFLLPDKAEVILKVPEENYRHIG